MFVRGKGLVEIAPKWLQLMSVVDFSPKGRSLSNPSEAVSGQGQFDRIVTGQLRRLDAQQTWTSNRENGHCIHLSSQVGAHRGCGLKSTPSTWEVSGRKVETEWVGKI